MAILRTIRTARHLRFSQIYSRLCYQWERKATADPTRWSFSGNNPPAIRTKFLCPEFRDYPSLDLTKLLAHGRFQELNERRDLGHEKTNWLLGSCSSGRLWTITLHYHRWLVALARSIVEKRDESTDASKFFRSYLSDWIKRCGLEIDGARDLAWNSYAIATRVESWAAAYSLLPEEFWSSSGELKIFFLRSLWQQAAYLHDHLEYDLRANHLIRDAAGLAYAGRFFEGDQPRRWLDSATQLALEQSGEQILADGGHFERSPMYHLEVMRDFYSLATLLENSEAKKQLIGVWSRMAQFAIWIRHPDGKIPLLNDAAFNGSGSPDQILALGKHLGINCDESAASGGKHFEQTGLVVWHGSPWSIFFDIGPLGPDYQPGHGHADTLTLECSYKGARLFIDPGTHSYDLDERRHYDRSTQAHNTVCIDGKDSSEVWHIFRVGDRAYPSEVSIQFANGRMNAFASHTGYIQLPGQPKHSRRVEINADGTLTVTDTIDGSGKHRLEGGWLLDPGWSARSIAGGWELIGKTGNVRVMLKSSGVLKLSEKECNYHPEFGLELKTTRLCWEIESALPVTVTSHIG